MGKFLPEFDGKQKCLRRFLCPSLCDFGCRRPVESLIDFTGGKNTGVIFQFVESLGLLFRIKSAVPTLGRRPGIRKTSGANLYIFARDHAATFSSQTMTSYIPTTTILPVILPL